MRACNRTLLSPCARYALSWRIANRRRDFNLTQQHAAEQAAALHRPLVVCEALRGGDRWASDRLHAGVLQGMANNAKAFAGAPVLYYPGWSATPLMAGDCWSRFPAEACLVVTVTSPRVSCCACWRRWRLACRSSA